MNRKPFHKGEYYAKCMQVKKAMKLTEFPIINKLDDPIFWDLWRQYYNWRAMYASIGLMDRNVTKTVPCFDPKSFDPAWPEHFDIPENYAQADVSPDFRSLLTTAFKAWQPPTPEAKARVAEIMRKYNAGIPVNDEVAQLWARMEPFWQSGSPAYVGQTKIPEPPPKRSGEEILADLEAHANDPFEVTPALEKALELKAKILKEAQGDPT